MENINKSKWGFHLLNFEDFKKVKLLHKYYWIAKVSVAAHYRWERKHPKNRKKEPWCPDIYRELINKPIVPLYQQARYPNEDVKYIKPLLIKLTQIEFWLYEINKVNDEFKLKKEVCC